MGETDVRALSESDHREADELFRQALFLPPADDESWERTARRMEPGRVLGAYLHGEMAGTALSMTSALTVPGGAELPAAAVTGVAVRADSTRRGLLTAMMRAQLDDAAARGEIAAMLHATEARIYGRFGYGVASRARHVEVDRAKARLRGSVPRGGRVRLIGDERARELLPALYRERAPRAGGMHRPEGWWPARDAILSKRRSFAVHADESGVDDGYAVYQPREGSSGVEVWDLVAANDIAAAELWRFLLDIDLVETVTAFDRPLDEPLEWWLTDRRACRVTGVDDDLWLRLVDVPAALRARTYGSAEPVVVEVTDEFLPANTGRYRIGPHGAEACDDTPQLAVDAAALAALYLGDQPASALASAGLVQVHDPAALPAADRLLATARPPWCGTRF